MKLLITGGILIVTLLGYVPCVAAQSHAGFIRDECQGYFIIGDDGKSRCAKGTKLFIGDKITSKQGVNSNIIDLAPFAAIEKVDKETMQIVLIPPKEKSDIFCQTMKFLGFSKRSYKTIVTGTRGGEYGSKSPSPDNGATVLPGQKITFSWCSGQGKSFLIKDAEDKEVFVQDITRKTLIQIMPKDAGMKPGSLYTWMVKGEGIDIQYRIRTAEEKMALLISSDLRKIDNEKIRYEEKLVKKAGYLQLMSNTYPQEVDLYWLSKTYLEEIKDENSLSVDNKIIKDELRKNYNYSVQEKQEKINFPASSNRVSEPNLD
jgi:hypothetical protein